MNSSETGGGDKDWTEEQTGRGGPTGAPAWDPDLEPPSLAQDENDVVSGGGVVDREDRHDEPPADQNTDVD